MAKNKTYTWMAVAIIVVLAFGFMTSWTFNPSNFAFPSSGTPQGGGGQVVNPTAQQSVTKPLKIVGTDELAGGALDGTTSACIIYDSDGNTLLETLSFSSGYCTSSSSYSSGRQLWLKYYYDTTIDAYMWWHITVPTMSQADAQSLTTNSINLRTREAGAYTDSLLTSSGYTFTDGLVMNTTGTSNDTGTFTYNYFTTTDNTGYPSFHDPIYNLDVTAVVWCELSGGNYATITMNGFDGGFEKGSTMYYYKVINQNDVSKYKVGNNYVYPGAGSTTFSFTATGYSNSTAAAYTTMQLYLKIYSSSAYMQQYGSYGPYAATGSEQTVLFEDIS